MFSRPQIRRVRLSTVLLPAAALVALTLTTPPVMVAQTTTSGVEHILIRTPKPYANVVSRIQAMGGKVTKQFKYVNAIAVEVPRASIDSVRALVGPQAISKDAIVPMPEVVTATPAEKSLGPASDLEIMASSIDGVAVTGGAGIQPTGYVLNDSLMNLFPLFNAGFLGQGQTVAVIDSGLRPGFPHIELDGSVVGCEDFVGDALGCTNAANNGHGTFVAGMISANVTFTFGGTSTFAQAVATYCPGCSMPSGPNIQVPMLGSAPSSSIFALRVFAATGGSPTSRILDAVERVIELQDLYNAGDPAGRRIDVCNMSLGGSTLFAGRDLFDQEVDAMLNRNIVLVVSAGNAGPSGLTGGSPGTAFEALTVGAASHAHNERILRDVQFGAGIGALFRPFGGTQTAYFSSRGPTADGRPDPDVTANGFASYGQGLGASANSISLASGTSFSGPSAAGVAAVLRQRFPSKTARQIRNALIMSANPNLLADGSTEMDQGAGFVNGTAAANLLAAGVVPNTTAKPHKPRRRVAKNIEKGTGLEVLSGNVLEHVSDLKPAERAEFIYEVKEKTAQVVIDVFNFTAGATQNELFGEDLVLAIHSAKTSSIDDGDYQFFGFVTGGTFIIDDPEPGLLRVTVNGDWTNAGNVSTDVAIFSLTAPLPRQTASGPISEGATAFVPINIPSGVAKAEFSLSWKYNWSRYPTNDIDMTLNPPTGPAILTGATLNSPESVVINNPAAGLWLVLINGFEMPTHHDRYTLRVLLDGKVVK